MHYGTSLDKIWGSQAGLITLFYGLYFGTLGRDFVDRLSDRMATSMGYYSQTGFPSRHLQTNMCAICGESTEGIGREGLHVLECNHSFHPVCIRGWTIIGKKDMCPSEFLFWYLPLMYSRAFTTTQDCKEKVDLKAFKTNPWDTAQILYLNLLDALRYLLVWNPLVFLVVHFVFKLFGFH